MILDRGPGFVVFGEADATTWAGTIGILRLTIALSRYRYSRYGRCRKPGSCSTTLSASAPCTSENSTLLPYNLFF